jgi:oxygen-independent coproporphyrinogen-3 oxidase
LFGIYIHFPYCRQRCTYCDFAVSIKKTIPKERYLHAILAELAQRGPLFAGRRAVSIYFGGGTPSLWPGECIAAVVEAVLARFPPQGPEPEITVECDPKDLDIEVLLALKQAGVNRLSLGAQTFNDAQLSQLGRKHCAQDIPAAVERARAVGFANLSLDLLIGLSRQQTSELLDDTRRLLALCPEHISTYQLTVEPGTALAASIRRGKTPRPDDDTQADFYDRVRGLLADAGYQHYEISSFARRKGRDLRAVHNRLYWNLGEYLGLGVSAHSFRALPYPHGLGGERFANPRSTETYLSLFAPSAAAPSSPSPSNDPRLAHYEAIDPSALAREALWLGLRQMAGICRKTFAQRHGIDPLVLGGIEAERLCSQGLLEADTTTLRLSHRGVLYADTVGAALL